MTGRTWSDTDKEALLRLHRSGMTYDEIAAELRRSIQGVKQVANSLGIRVPRSESTRGRPLPDGEEFIAWTPWRDRELIAMRQRGATDQQCADALKMPLAQVRARKFGAPA